MLVNHINRHSRIIMKKKKKKKQNPMDIVYRRVAQAQSGKEGVVIRVSLVESPVIENILQDANLCFNKEQSQEICIYTLSKKDEPDTVEVLLEEYLNDEIPLPGQIC